ncbi:MAG: hypothetical protein AAFV53_05040 [Myxococcota bacterium]
MNFLIPFLLGSALAEEVSVEFSSDSGPRVLVLDLKTTSSQSADRRPVISYRQVVPGWRQPKVERALGQPECTPGESTSECKVPLIMWDGDHWKILVPRPPSTGSRYLFWVNMLTDITADEREEIIKETNAARSALDELLYSPGAEATGLNIQGDETTNQERIVAYRVTGDTKTLQAHLDRLKTYSTEDGQTGDQYISNSLLPLKVGENNVEVKSSFWTKDFLSNLNISENWENTRKTLSQKEDFCSKNTIEDIRWKSGERSAVEDALNSCLQKLGQTAATADNLLSVQIAIDSVRTSGSLNDQQALDLSSANLLYLWLENNNRTEQLSNLFSNISRKLSHSLTLSSPEADIGEARYFDLTTGMVYVGQLDDVVVPYQISLCPFGCIRERRAFWWSGRDALSAFSVDLGRSFSTVGTEDNRVEGQPNVMAGASYGVLPILRVGGGAFFFENKNTDQWERSWYAGISIDIGQASEIFKPFGLTLPKESNLDGEDPNTRDAESASSDSNENETPTQTTEVVNEGNANEAAAPPSTPESNSK